MNILDLFRHQIDVNHWAAGDVIFEKGMPGDKMYVVKDGEVYIRIGDKVLVVAGPGIFWITSKNKNVAATERQNRIIIET